jgi:hypothetical protein
MSAEILALAAVRQIATRLGGVLLIPELPLARLGSRADYGLALGSSHSSYLYVEIEVGQTHPTTNVLKYWPWLDEDERRSLILVQLFQGNKHRRSLTQWLSERMTRELGGRFRYFGLDLPLEDAALEAIAAEVAAAWKD